MIDELDTSLIIDDPPKTEGRRWTSNARRGFIIVAIILACSGGLFAVLARGVWKAREAARRSQCSCNLCGIKMGLLQYHDAYGVLPPVYVADASGKPMHSWRVLILPFMEYQALYEQYNFAEPWDGPNNIKLLPKMPTSFACPSHRARPTTLTSYVVITGPGTSFPGDISTRFADITDGPSQTLLIAETATMTIPWTAPRDLDVRTMSFRVNDPDRPSISSKHPGGANVVYADSSYGFLPDTISPSHLQALTTIAGSEVIDGKGSK